MVILFFSLISCDKLGKKIENYDLFGLERANEGIQMQEEKIKRAQEYQKSMGQVRSKAYNDPNILQY